MNKSKKFIAFCCRTRIKTTVVLLTLVVFIFGLSASALALETGIGFGTATGLSTQDIRITIANVIRIALGFLAILAIIIIVYAGYTWMTAAGNDEKIATAKKTLTNGAIGLAIIMFAFAIVTFIINMLSGAIGGNGQPVGPTPPPTGCENCGHLGGGIIESVYPVPQSKDVPRDTVIIVTFKEEMKAGTIMAGVSNDVTCTADPVSNPCLNKNIQDTIKIYKRAEYDRDFTKALATNEVLVTSQDNKTYVFRPVAPLGESTAKHWYTTRLSGEIRRKNTNESAFAGVSDYFSWDFEVGTRLDLVPPKISDVFPSPDSEPDSYTKQSATRASGRLQINKQPNIEQLASASLANECNDGVDNDSDGQADGNDPQCAGVNDITTEDNGNTALVQLSGSYNGAYQGTKTYAIGTGRASLTEGGNTYAIDASDKAVLGNGITVAFQDDNYAEGMSVKFKYLPKLDPSVLQVGNTVYRFVSQTKASPANNEIKLTGDPGSTSNISGLRDNIKNKIDQTTETPNIMAGYVISDGVSDVDKVSLVSELAGKNSNYINISTNSDWAVISYPRTLGTDENTVGICSANQLCDQPKNSIIRLDFSEAVMPMAVSGKVLITDGDGNGVGTLASDVNITVKADINHDGEFDENEFVAGTFVQSNQYKTVEFLALKPCDGYETNSCGDPMFCLPVDPERDVTKYQIIISAATLETCTTNSCAGKGYDNGVKTETCQDIPLGATAPGTPTPVCGNNDAAKPYFYPKAVFGSAGIIDLANNSFDGNRNGFSQGPILQSLANRFSLNEMAKTKVCDNQTGNNSGIDCTSNALICTKGATSCREAGDGLIYTFYIKNKVDVSAPVVVNITPSVSGSGSSLIAPITGKASKLLQSSTVKPGTGYRDGKCTCDEDEDCPGAPDQICKNSYCVNRNNPQQYCANNNQCGEGQTCQQRRYVFLHDRTTSKAGWWISNFGEDIRKCLNETFYNKECTSHTSCCEDPAACSVDYCSKKDNYSDRSIVTVNHSQLMESTEYGAEIASGVKDIYQNCFVPGKGPVASECNPYPGGSGCCTVSETNPYCCNGVPSGLSCSF